MRSREFSMGWRRTMVGLLLAGVTASSALAAEGFYARRDLVSDGYTASEHIDPNLVNGWGVAFNPTGFVWVASADGMVSTLYDGNGVPQTLVVQIPLPGAPTGGNPTGIVFSGSSAFQVSNGTTTAPARFIFATEQGAIAGWAPSVNLTQAILAVDNSAAGANYKGLAISAGGAGPMIYATDFFNARVDAFDGSFQPATLPAGAFTDPSLPAGYAPFGIQAIGGNIYVTYAKQNAERDEEVAGQGLGFVNVYAPDGTLLARAVSRGQLDAPWGLTQAPAGFGRFSNALLVGNFGDGRINAFDLKNGTFLGTLRGQDNKPIEIDGLWGIAFGNGVQNQPVNTLFFAAGPEEEEHGLYGRLDFVAGK